MVQGGKVQQLPFRRVENASKLHEPCVCLVRSKAVEHVGFPAELFPAGQIILCVAQSHNKDHYCLTVILYHELELRITEGLKPEDI
jgi:hypothetical protein